MLWGRHRRRTLLFCPLGFFWEIEYDDCSRVLGAYESWQYDGRKKHVVNSLQCEDNLSRPLKRRTHVPPLLQGLHSCDSDNKRDATLESDNVQRCCVYTILTLMEVQEASARTSHPCDGCPHVQAALSALPFQMLEQLSLARNIG